MRIYLDTDIWNALFYQNVRPTDLMDRLARRNAGLAFSLHNLFEIAKSFHETKAETRAKGKKLVAFLSGFFDGPIEHPIETGQLLIAEAKAHKVPRAPFEDEIFVKASDTNLFRQESRALLSEPLRPDIADFIAKRKLKVQNLRVGCMGNLASRPALSDRLKAIPAENLESFLAGEVTSSQAVRILDFHLHHVLPALLSRELRNLSNLLLYSGSAPFAHALVKATFYMNWRAANHNGLPSDVPDDMYHILNATYCDIYATGEAKQSYATHLLAPRTLFKPYPRGGAISVDDWLVSLI